MGAVKELVLAALEDAVKAIQSGGSVSFRHCGVVEGRLDKILHRIRRRRLAHDRLTDVHDLRCLVAKTMNPE